MGNGSRGSVTTRFAKRPTGLVFARLVNPGRAQCRRGGQCGRGGRHDSGELSTRPAVGGSYPGNSVPSSVTGKASHDRTITSVPTFPLRSTPHLPLPPLFPVPISELSSDLARSSASGIGANTFSSIADEAPAGPGNDHVAIKEIRTGQNQILPNLPH